MSYENEITVQVKKDYEQLHRELEKKGFHIVEKYQMEDTYLLKKNFDVTNVPLLKILKECVIVRDVKGKEKELLYKYKKYGPKGIILKQRKISCPIYSIRQALSFMKAIHYKQLLKINDSCIVYSNHDIEFTVQLVNDKYIFIEMENHTADYSKQYESIEEMIKALEKYDISYDKSDYFVKKAALLLEEMQESRDK